MDGPDSFLICWLSFITSTFTSSLTSSSPSSLSKPPTQKTTTRGFLWCCVVGFSVVWCCVCGVAANYKIERKMSLGKRSRPPMKRTASLTEITFDLGGSAVEQLGYPANTQKAGFGGSDQRFLQHMVSPRNYRRHSADLKDTANFLRACSLCNRPLVPGRDIYMYRGDKAFCSDECRQKQMKQDERMEKCSIASKKAAAASPSASVPPQISGKGETVAAS